MSDFFRSERESLIASTACSELRGAPGGVAEVGCLAWDRLDRGQMQQHSPLNQHSLRVAAGCSVGLPKGGCSLKGKGV